MPTTLGVVGTGSVLSDLIQGRSRSSEPFEVVLFDTKAEQRADLARVHGLAVAASFDELAARSEVIVVASERADALDALEALASHLGEDHVVVMFSAAITLDRMRAALGPGPALLRVSLGPGGLEERLLMLSPESGTTVEVIERTTRFLACMGVVEALSEESLEAASAVIRSSADLLATALEGMEDGAVKTGLPRDLARVFVRQTFLAAALLLRGHPGSPADLKDQVASPAGTTMAGLAVLEDLGVRGAFMQAVEAAVARALEERDEDESHVVE